jgi:hypothetical protein
MKKAGHCPAFLFFWSVIPGRAKRGPGIQTQTPGSHLDSGFVHFMRTPE